MKLLLLMLTYTVVFAKVYYSKADPYEIRTISSNVSGKVELTSDYLIGKKLTNKAYITIESILDKQELTFLIEKQNIIENTILVNGDILKNYDLLLKKKKENYKQIENLKIKSRIEKDKEYYDLVSSENTYLNIKKEINNLKVQLQDLKLRKAQLEKTIADKSLRANGFVLYSIDVKVGQVVTPATPLAHIADLSKAILTIYLDKEDITNLKLKHIYLDNKKTTYKIDRLLLISDSKNISKYKAQIIIKAPKLFSKLTKVEIK